MTVLHFENQLFFYRIDVPNSNSLPLLNQRYHFFMGGVPAETPMVSGAAPTKAPFIGCLRDVLIEKDIVDFNSVIYHTGVEMNTCSVETVESGTSLGSDVTTGMYTVGGKNTAD